MAITKIKWQSACPYGHEDIEYVEMHKHHAWVFCYKCLKKYYQEDFEA